MRFARGSSPIGRSGPTSSSGARSNAFSSRLRSAVSIYELSRRSRRRAKVRRRGVMELVQQLEQLYGVLPGVKSAVDAQCYLCRASTCPYVCWAVTVVVVSGPFLFPFPVASTASCAGQTPEHQPSRRPSPATAFLPSLTSAAVLAHYALSLRPRLLFLCRFLPA